MWHDNHINYTQQHSYHLMNNLTLVTGNYDWKIQIFGTNCPINRDNTRNLSSLTDFEQIVVQEQPDTVQVADNTL